MGAVPTLKDIAERLNLSIGTVQRALHNKGGYSKETQELVLAEARRCGYIVNPAASVLRRPRINIAVVFPFPVEHNRYFFQYVWQGIEQARQDFAVYNLKIFPYYAEPGTDNATKMLEQLLTDTETAVHGLITNAPSNPQTLSVLEQLSDRNIPIFLINAVSPYKQKLFYSVNANQGVGKLGADICLAVHKRNQGKVLVLGGSRTNERQSMRSNDFISHLSSSCPDLFIQELHVYENLAQLKNILAEYLQKLDNIIAIYAVSARETMIMCDVVSELGRSGTITTIGTDVFPELLPYFEDDTLTASIYQYPAQQAYTAVQTLLSHIVTTPFQKSNLSLPAVPVFKSNATAFCDPVRFISSSN